MVLAPIYIAPLLFLKEKWLDEDPEKSSVLKYVATFKDSLGQGKWLKEIFRSPKAKSESMKVCSFMGCCSFLNLSSLSVSSSFSAFRSAQSSLCVGLLTLVCYQVSLILVLVFHDML